MRLREYVYTSGALTILLVALTGCGGGSSDDSSDGNGSLTLGLVDGPVEGAEQVVVAFTGIELKPDNGPPMEPIPMDESACDDFDSATGTCSINLLDLVGTDRRVVFSESLPAGHYQWVRLLVNAETLEPRQAPFSVESLMMRLRANVPDAPVVESQLLTDYDWYYYSRGRQTPLPLLRVKFDDPAQTRLYVDPEMSQVLAQIHRLNRVERWLYNGLHSLDFAFWYDKRLLWDIGMITLSLGGLSLSTIGLFLGIKRVRRGTARIVRAATPRRSPCWR